MFEKGFQKKTSTCREKKIIFIKFLFTVAGLAAIIFRTEAEVHKGSVSVRDSKIYKNGGGTR